MRALRDFWRGVTMQHVDYSTRHYSRVYARGQTAGAVAVLAGLPLLLLGAAGWFGWIVGKWSCCS